MNTADDLLRRALESLEEMDAGLESEYGTPFSKWLQPPIIKEIRAYLDAPKDEDEPTAWMFPDDIERFQTEETFAQAFSIKCGSPTQGTTLPLYLHPPTKTAPMKPMTDAEILKEWQCHFYDDGWIGFEAGVRFAERHHGITGEEK